VLSNSNSNSNSNNISISICNSNDIEEQLPFVVKRQRAKKKKTNKATQKLGLTRQNNASRNSADADAEVYADVGKLMRMWMWMPWRERSEK
jgi:hypothetical protein